MFGAGTDMNIFLKFLWVGLIYGIIYIFCKFIIRLFHKNVYVTNLVMFCFWLLFGGTFAFYCIAYNNYSFSLGGLGCMAAGFILVKFSIDFFFTKICKVIYNKFRNLKKRKNQDVNNLRTNEKN